MSVGYPGLVSLRIIRIDTHCASQAHLVFTCCRTIPHASRDRAAIRRNQLAGSLSDVSWRLPDADFLSEILRMDSVQYADNLISELLLFFALNVLGYAFVIFLLLRIFFPDRSSELPPLTGKK